MALISIRSRARLASPVILAPERYDPRRKLDTKGDEVIELGEIVISVRKMVQPSTEIGECLVLDTSDIREGIIIDRKRPVMGIEIGSAKKEVRAGDVIISRLRPYLRQVAFVDKEIPNTKILCSTEFFVLRSIDDLPIAFLVPFLLSSKIQEVLKASQEGGHHPRFIESALLTLPIPKKLLLQRETISEVIKNSIYLYRSSEKGIADMVLESDDTLS
jgi:restriction endonuclease S subunit